MLRLNKTEFDLLRHLLGGEQTVKELAKNIQKSTKRTSALTLDLNKKGFVRRSREGMTYRVGFSSNTFAHLLKELMLRDIPIERFLTDSRIDAAALLAWASHPLRSRDIVFITQLSPSIVRYAIRDMMRYGLLKKVGTAYLFSDSMKSVRRFLLEYTSFTNHRMVSAMTSDAIIEWQMGFEFIFTTEKVLNGRNINPTGVTTFSRSGMTILTDRFTYHHVPIGRVLKREDWIIDNILAHTNSMTHTLYSLIFLKMNLDFIDGEEIIERSCMYGLGPLGEDMLKYVKDGMDIPGFPKRNEFNEKYAMYGGDA